MCMRRGKPIFCAFSSLSPYYSIWHGSPFLCFNYKSTNVLLFNYSWSGHKNTSKTNGTNSIYLLYLTAGLTSWILSQSNFLLSSAFFTFSVCSGLLAPFHAFDRSSMLSSRLLEPSNGWSYSCAYSTTLQHVVAWFCSRSTIHFILGDCYNLSWLYL